MTLVQSRGGDCYVITRWFWSRKDRLAEQLELSIQGHTAIGASWSSFSDLFLDERT